MVITLHGKKSKMCKHNLDINQLCGPFYPMQTLCMRKRVKYVNITQILTNFVVLFIQCRQISTLKRFFREFRPECCTALQLCIACKCFCSHHLTSYFDPCIVCNGVSTPIKNTTSLKLEQITFCQRTNFRVHKGIYSA